MIAAIFVVPLIYFINAFFIGRLIKKWKINVNPFLATILGFIAFFDVIYFISIWMYAGRAIIWSYFIVFGVIQSILLMFYIANWRRIFITWSVNYKKIITFVIAFGLTILIGWLNFREYNSEFARNWIWAIDHTQTDIWLPMWFGTGSSDVVSNFSAYNVMNLFWINLFKVYSREAAITFCNWSWTIIAAGFVACLSTWMINSNTSITKVIFTLILTLFFVVMILAFIETFAIGDSWVLLLLFAYVLMMVKIENFEAIKIFSLTTTLIGFLAVSCTSFFTVICVWIFTMYYVVRSKQNSLNYLIFLSWPLLLTISSLLSIYTFPLLSIIDALYLAIAIIFISTFAKLGVPSWHTRISLGIYRHSGKIIYAVLIVFIAIVLMANFFIFQEIYKWDGKNIDYRNFLTFTYTYLWNVNITSPVAIALFNAIMYALFTAVAIAYVVIRSMRRHKLKHLCKTDYAVKFGVLSCILFINPLVIHVLKLSASLFPLNTLDLNMLFVVPIFAVILKVINNYKQVTLNEWKYNWY